MASLLDGADISGILNSEGNVVKCVVLHAGPSKKLQKVVNSSSTTVSDEKQNEQESKNKSEDSKSDESNKGIQEKSPEVKEANTNGADDGKKDASCASDEKDTISGGAGTSNDDSVPKPVVYELSDLVSEISIDTTPKLRMAEKTLGGPVTFLGQYSELGVIVMARRQDTFAQSNESQQAQEEELEPESKSKQDDSISAGKSENDDTSHPQSEEKVENETESEKENDGIVPINMHPLQPPLHKSNGKIRGDILLMKTIDEDDEGGVDQPDFFKDFSKSEYLEFASRTDIVPNDDDDDDELGELELEAGSDDTIDDDEDLDEGLESGDDDEDGEFMGEGMDEEEEKIGMMNLVMGQILRRFHEENGRGPDRKELLAMRQALAEKLGIDSLPPLSDSEDEEDEEETEATAAAEEKSEEKEKEETSEQNGKGEKRSLKDGEDEKPRKKVRWSISSDEEKVESGAQ